MTTLRTDSTHSGITIDYADGSYRPAYKSVAQWQQDKVAADPMQGVTFRNNMGAPYAKANGEILLRGEPQPGETPVYAHMAETDSTTKVVGKLNLLTFEPREISVCLVPVNGATPPNAQTLEKELNKIFKPAVASVKLSTATPINIQYANGENFVHGGSGLLSVYSEDEKNAIKALQNADNETYYLFVVDNVTRLNPDGTAMKDILAGYMPIGYQCGFLFGSPAAKYVAHELGHGAFGLHHTFSSETESFSAPQYSTDNLMDYADGATLNHKQWSWMHEKHGSGLFGFLADEEDAEYVEESPTNEVVRFLNTIRCAKANNLDIVDSYHSLNNYSVKVSNLLSIIDNQNGTSSIASDEFKNAVLNVFIDGGMYSSANVYLGYHQFSIAVNDIKRSDTPAKLIFSTNGKPTIFSVDNTTADISTQNEVLDWIERVVAEPIIKYTYNGEIHSLFTLSKCQFEQIEIDTRKTLIQNAFDNTETFLGLDRDTYQYLMINLISTTPEDQVPDIFDFLYTRPEILIYLYKSIDDYREEFYYCLLELTKKAYEHSSFIKEKAISKLGIENLFNNNIKVIKSIGQFDENQIVFSNIKRDYWDITGFGLVSSLSQEESELFSISPLDIIVTELNVSKPGSVFQGNGVNKTFIKLPAICVKYMLDEQDKQFNWERFEQLMQNASYAALLYVGVDYAIMSNNIYI